MNNIIQIGLEVIAGIGGIGAIIIGIAKYVGKIFADKYIEKIKSDFEKEVNRHETQLKIIASRATKFHDKRLEKIEELYKKIIRLQEAMKPMTAKLKFYSADKMERDLEAFQPMIKARNCWEEFKDFYFENKIFFTIESCKLLDALTKDFLSSYISYHEANTYEKPNKESAALKHEANEIIFKDIPPILDSLEKEFRLLIDVDETISK